MNASTESSVKKIIELTEGIELAMMTTVTPEGTLRSRPMATLEQSPDDSLWFFTALGSPKTLDIIHDRRVNVSYSDPRRQRFVSVSGLAEIVRDREMIEQLWSPVLLAWFPKGTEDPTVVLVKVSVTAAEFWDGHERGMTELIEGRLQKVA